MAEIEIRWGQGAVRRVLATSTLLGRHRSCTWSFDVPQVPLYWLELRWVGHWAWRELAPLETTRGPGRVGPGGWRKIRQGERILGPVELTLADASAPAAFAVDLDEGTVLDDVDAVVEQRRDGPWPVGAEADHRRTGPLDDGEVFVVGGQILRYHAGEAHSGTMRPTASLASPSCELALEARDGSYRLTVIDTAETVQLDAEYVRVLVPYVEVRRRDMPPGGWLELDAAHFRWQQLGGSADSHRDRIAQDRSRLCRALAKQGVGQASSLFETKRGPEGWVTRVSLPAKRLFVD